MQRLKRALKDLSGKRSRDTGQRNADISGATGSRDRSRERAELLEMTRRNTKEQKVIDLRRLLEERNNPEDTINKISDEPEEQKDKQGEQADEPKSSEEIQVNPKVTLGQKKRSLDEIDEDIEKVIMRSNIEITKENATLIRFVNLHELYKHLGAQSDAHMKVYEREAQPDDHVMKYVQKEMDQVLKTNGFYFSQDKEKRHLELLKGLWGQHDELEGQFGSDLVQGAIDRVLRRLYAVTSDASTSDEALLPVKRLTKLWKLCDQLEWQPEWQSDDQMKKYMQKAMDRELLRSLAVVPADEKDRCLALLKGLWELRGDLEKEPSGSNLVKKELNRVLRVKDATAFLLAAARLGKLGELQDHLYQKLSEGQRQEYNQQELEKRDLVQKVIDQVLRWSDASTSDEALLPVERFGKLSKLRDQLEGWPDDQKEYVQKAMDRELLRSLAVVPTDEKDRCLALLKGLWELRSDLEKELFGGDLVEKELDRILRVKDASTLRRTPLLPAERLGKLGELQDHLCQKLSEGQRQEYNQQECDLVQKVIDQVLRWSDASPSDEALLPVARLRKLWKLRDQLEKLPGDQGKAYVQKEIDRELLGPAASTLEKDLLPVTRFIKLWELCNRPEVQSDNQINVDVQKEIDRVLEEEERRLTLLKDLDQHRDNLGKQLGSDLLVQGARDRVLIGPAASTLEKDLLPVARLIKLWELCNQPEKQIEAFVQEEMDRILETDASPSERRLTLLKDLDQHRDNLGKQLGSDLLVQGARDRVLIGPAASTLEEDLLPVARLVSLCELRDNVSQLISDQPKKERDQLEKGRDQLKEKRHRFRILRKGRDKNIPKQEIAKLGREVDTSEMYIGRKKEYNDLVQKMSNQFLAIDDSICSNEDILPAARIVGLWKVRDDVSELISDLERQPGGQNEVRDRKIEKLKAYQDSVQTESRRELRAYCDRVQTESGQKFFWRERYLVLWELCNHLEGMHLGLEERLKSLRKQSEGRGGADDGEEISKLKERVDQAERYLGLVRTERDRELLGTRVIPSDKEVRNLGWVVGLWQLWSRLNRRYHEYRQQLQDLKKQPGDSDNTARERAISELEERVDQTKWHLESVRTGCDSELLGESLPSDKDLLPAARLVGLWRLRDRVPGLISDLEGHSGGQDEVRNRKIGELKAYQDGVQTGSSLELQAYHRHVQTESGRKFFWEERYLVLWELCDHLERMHLDLEKRLTDLRKQPRDSDNTAREREISELKERVDQASNYCAQMRTERDRELREAKALPKNSEGKPVDQKQGEQSLLETNDLPSEASLRLGQLKSLWKLCDHLKTCSGDRVGEYQKRVQKEIDRVLLGYYPDDSDTDKDALNLKRFKALQKLYDNLSVLLSVGEDDPLRKNDPLRQEAEFLSVLERQLESGYGENWIKDERGSEYNRTFVLSQRSRVESLLKSRLELIGEEKGFEVESKDLITQTKEDIAKIKPRPKMYAILNEDRALLPGDWYMEYVKDIRKWVPLKCGEDDPLYQKVSDLVKLKNERKDCVSRSDESGVQRLDRQILVKEQPMVSLATSRFKLYEQEGNDILSEWRIRELLEQTRWDAELLQVKDIPNLSAQNVERLSTEQKNLLEHLVKEIKQSIEELRKSGKWREGKYLPISAVDDEFYIPLFGEHDPLEQERMYSSVLNEQLRSRFGIDWGEYGESDNFRRTVVPRQDLRVERLLERRWRFMLRKELKVESDELIAQTKLDITWLPPRQNAEISVGKDGEKVALPEGWYPESVQGIEVPLKYAEDDPLCQQIRQLEDLKHKLEALERKPEDLKRKLEALERQLKGADLPEEEKGPLRIQVRAKQQEVAEAKKLKGAEELRDGITRQEQLVRSLAESRLKDLSMLLAGRISELLEQTQQHAERLQKVAMLDRLNGNVGELSSEEEEHLKQLVEEQNQSIKELCQSKEWDEKGVYISAIKKSLRIPSFSDDPLEQERMYSSVLYKQMKSRFGNNWSKDERGSALVSPQASRVQSLGISRLKLILGKELKVGSGELIIQTQQDIAGLPPRQDAEISVGKGRGKVALPEGWYPESVQDINEQVPLKYAEDDVLCQEIRKLEALKKEENKSSSSSSAEELRGDIARQEQLVQFLAASRLGLVSEDSGMLSKWRIDGLLEQTQKAAMLNRLDGNVDELPPAEKANLKRLVEEQNQSIKALCRSKKWGKRYVPVSAIESNLCIPSVEGDPLEQELMHLSVLEMHVEIGFGNNWTRDEQGSEYYNTVVLPQALRVKSLGISRLKLILEKNSEVQSEKLVERSKQDIILQQREKHSIRVSPKEETTLSDVDRAYRSLFDELDQKEESLAENWYPGYVRYIDKQVPLKCSVDDPLYQRFSELVALKKEYELFSSEELHEQILEQENFVRSLAEFRLKLIEETDILSRNIDLLLTQTRRDIAAAQPGGTLRSMFSPGSSGTSGMNVLSQTSRNPFGSYSGS